MESIASHMVTTWDAGRGRNQIPKRALLTYAQTIIIISSSSRLNTSQLDDQNGIDRKQTVI